MGLALALWPPRMKIKKAKKKKKLVVVAEPKHISGNIRSLIYSWLWISGSVGDYCTSPFPLAALLHRPALPKDDPTSPAVIAHLLGSLTTNKPAGISYSLSYYASAGRRRRDVHCGGLKMHNSWAVLFPWGGGAVRAGLYWSFVYRKTACFVLLFSRHYRKKKKNAGCSYRENLLKVAESHNPVMAQQ